MDGTHSQPATESIVLGGGCFWCLEAVFVEMIGIVSVEPGYAGGHQANPSYEQVCTGNTGHAEVVEIRFDPALISREDLLRMFFVLHDPTTLNRQGADIGTQYRSVIYWQDEAQREDALKIRDEMNAAEVWPSPVVTEITKLDHFWPAEAKHRNYFARNPDAGYCRVVIAPKVAKLRQHFTSRVKPAA